MSDFEGNFEIVGMPEVRVFSSVDASTEQPEKGKEDNLHNRFEDAFTENLNDTLVALSVIVGAGAILFAATHAKKPLKTYFDDRKTGE